MSCHIVLLMGKTMAPSTETETLVAFAEQIADSARGLALQYFRTTFEFERKADESPVTIADKAIETAMRAAIEKQYPEHGIYGEETGRTSGNEGLWVLDPIDGTKSFLTGMPLFGALIAFLRSGDPEIGIIEMPALGERWVGAGGKTKLNGKEVRVSDQKSLEDAMVYTTSPDFYKSEADWGAFDRVSKLAAIRRFGGDCYPYALLASGHCDLVIDPSMMPYDFLPLVPVIENAGGLITDWDGNALTLDSGDHVIAASSPWLLERALKELKR